MYPDYVHALLSKDIYIENVDDILLEQTHLSYVFINDIYVYKIKKSVDFDFVKQSKLSQRKKFCLQEIEQNKRLAPKVYIKVVKIVLSMLFVREKFLREIRLLNMLLKCIV
jgi:aminoglycoside phosphotransferase family enzyme